MTKVGVRQPPIGGYFGATDLNWQAEVCKDAGVRKVVYLSLGSNLGDREGNLRTAIERLAALGEVTAVSSFYETEPVEFARQPWFLNCAVALATEKMP
ncbi:MAG TPA: 2-amino-4-hydroxy-6-hydroxymethyldihydropteridine diphosphokinase, partial [Terriglobales bacterium]|nr:2-amino-4-hydroxy-6-hydroxymethyldihydropteridine diphosphokinase [Terriglobales bacterium]